ncbi:N-acetylmuramoyl-L-alanine amidase [Nocardioides euryhalodurans]|uniref:Peptidoglycan recognition protein family domain-containing protein n=1 Tax=Nocardioides euryhalodurans TaxID=2518370 RepID=A0A4P7GNW1_9ACTN|nr:N-acetylmuramoyl-L-alanine amidase [Nocardioides euryhalodurans]QBR93916.1 hypothetical protein EXE57_17720 [Nocardioides euryhalodurans]
MSLPLLAGLPPAAPAEAPPPMVRLTAADGSVVRAAEEPLARGTSRLQTTSYSLVGATWRGAAPRVWFRTAPAEAWRRLPVLEDGPTIGAAEASGARHGTDLVWTGPQRDVEVRVAGSGHRDLELVLIDPGTLATDRTAAPAPRAAATEAADGEARRPVLRTRQDWGAKPRLRNGRPRYLDRLQQVHVHHTATGNGYRRSDVPGIIRGMYRYHTQSLGWFDLGYNFLVDRFGRGWIGRSGGAHRLVQGAHTLGFNHQSVGVAVIGNLEQRRPSKGAVRMVTRIAAWKLDKHGRDAVGTVRTTSTGSDRYRDGQRVRLPVIDGHRDTNDTACPGQRLYDRLPAIRRRTQARIDG